MFQFCSQNLQSLAGGGVIGLGRKAAKSGYRTLADVSKVSENSSKSLTSGASLGS
jgi:hypothetical protein